MKPWYPFEEHIRLRVRKRGISVEDAKRQEITARDILQRLASRPGVILADEVGMGKTFVALAVAASVSLSDKRRRPVLVMVPPSLKDKWPLDFGVFVRECLPPELSARPKHAVAETGADFLKLIDDPISKRKSIIFLSHGAMHRGLGRGWAGGWIKLYIGGWEICSKWGGFNGGTRIYGRNSWTGQARSGLTFSWREASTLRVMAIRKPTMILFPKRLLRR
ncbi:MAG: SNF2-related protein [Verrucomicrobia bacterium]|nr:SNF2-related protein [Verrucomicrobiota bacterium]